uniref:Uncharacterized protein n=1 Tax=Rhizophora mucronata TaxID=61149 RepID=A0A2P2Q614_RHIMU
MFPLQARINLPVYGDQSVVRLKNLALGYKCQHFLRIIINLQISTAF